MRKRTMAEQHDLGMNRTGMQMSPQDSKRLLATTETTETIGRTAVGDPHAQAAMRERYIAEADPLGSVPLPGSVKGALVQGAKLLQGKHPEVFMDKLAERLAFERGGTRLYDALLIKFDASTEALEGVTRDELHRIREEEAAHFRMLSETIRSMGGDPTAQTPSADLVGVETAGLVQAIRDPRTTFADSLHAMLIAELADVDGWSTLMALADAAGENDLTSQFSAALEQENEHLLKVRSWYQRTVLNPA